MEPQPLKLDLIYNIKMIELIGLGMSKTPYNYEHFVAMLSMKGTYYDFFRGADSFSLNISFGNEWTTQTRFTRNNGIEIYLFPHNEVIRHLQENGSCGYYPRKLHFLNHNTVIEERKGPEDDGLDSKEIKVANDYVYAYLARINENVDIISNLGY